MEEYYDVFVSHASEDKDTVARPIAQKLKDLGLKVWYDEFTLNIGDKLRESIDNGLRNSKFGIVILSNSFFLKNWTKLELEGLVNLSMKNISRILPIWHNVDLEDVTNFSPMLASIKALPSSIGIDNIATKIYEVVTNMSQQNQYTSQPESPFVDVAGNTLRINEIQNKRFRLLLKLYQERDRTNIKKNNAFEVGSDLGYTGETINEILRYLHDKGYLEYPMIGPYVQITTSGIDYIEELIPNSGDVIKIRSNRMLFMKELYTIRGQNWGANMYELGKKLGFLEEKVTDDIVFYLEAHALLKFTMLGPFVGITTYGIDFVEQNNQ